MCILLLHAGWIIALIVVLTVGAVFLLLVLGLVIYIVKRHRRAKRGHYELPMVALQNQVNGGNGRVVHNPHRDGGAAVIDIPEADGGGAAVVDNPNADGGGAAVVDNPNADGGGAAVVDNPNADGGGAAVVDNPNADGGGAAVVDNPNADDGGAAVVDNPDADGGAAVIDNPDADGGAAVVDNPDADGGAAVVDNPDADGGAAVVDDPDADGGAAVVDNPDADGGAAVIDDPCHEGIDAVSDTPNLLDDEEDLPLPEDVTSVNQFPAVLEARQMQPVMVPAAIAEMLQRAHATEDSLQSPQPEEFQKNPSQQIAEQCTDCSNGYRTVDGVHRMASSRGSDGNAQHGVQHSMVRCDAEQSLVSVS